MNKLLIIITLVIISLGYNVKKETYTNIQNNSYWNDYRLSDVVSYYIYNKSFDTVVDSVNMIKSQPIRYPGSLAGDYIKYNTKNTKNVDLLMRLIEKKKIYYVRLNLTRFFI